MPTRCYWPIGCSGGLVIVSLVIALGMGGLFISILPAPVPMATLVGIGVTLLAISMFPGVSRKMRGFIAVIAGIPIVLGSFYPFFPPSPATDQEFILFFLPTQLAPLFLLCGVELYIFKNKLDALPVRILAGSLAGPSPKSW